MENNKTNSLVKILLTQESISKQRKVKMDCGSEAKALLDELILWKEESHRQISTIMESHGSNIKTGIRELEEEVISLKAEISLLRKERTVLLDTVGNLNSEIKHLNIKFQTLPELDKEFNYRTSVGENHDTEMYEAKCENQDTDNGLDCEVGDKSVDECVLDASINEQEKSESTNGSLTLDSFIDESGNEDDVDIDNTSTEGTEHDIGIEKTQKIDKVQFKYRSNKRVKRIKSGRYRCKQCPYESPKSQHVERHVKAVHDKMKSHVCEICGHASAQKVHLKYHMNTVHKIEIKSYKCGKCSYSTDLKINLQRHIQYEHYNRKEA